jgi:hypothetical protein
MDSLNGPVLRGNRPGRRKSVTVLVGKRQLRDRHGRGTVSGQAPPGCYNLKGNNHPPLFLTCQKLRFLAERNPGVKTVVLGLGCHNVSRYQESYLFEDFWEGGFEQYFGWSTPMAGTRSRVSAPTTWSPG